MVPTIKLGWGRRANLTAFYYFCFRQMLEVGKKVIHKLFCAGWTEHKLSLQRCREVSFYMLSFLHVITCRADFLTKQGLILASRERFPCKNWTGRQDSWLLVLVAVLQLASLMTTLSSRSIKEKHFLQVVLHLIWWKKQLQAVCAVEVFINDSLMMFHLNHFLAIWS